MVCTSYFLEGVFGVSASTSRGSIPEQRDDSEEMCSGSEAGSYLRLIDFVYHSNLGLRVIQEKKKMTRGGTSIPSSMAHTRKNLPMYYGEHGAVWFVGEGGESAKTSTTFKRVFKTFKHKQLLRDWGGRAVCQRWGMACDLLLGSKTLLKVVRS